MSIKFKLKKSFIISLETLSIHGLPNIIKKKNKIIRAWWILLTMTSSILSIYFIRQILIEYYRYNVTTEMRIVDSNEIEFPTITICEFNQLSTIESYNDFNYLFDILNHSDSINLILHVIHGWKIFSNQPELNVNERKKYSKSIDKMLRSCYFNNQKCTHHDFKWLFNENFANCYQFNSYLLNNVSKRMMVNRLGPINGLKLILNLTLPDEIERYGLKKGVYVSINDKYDNVYADFDDATLIFGGTESNIKIEKSSFNKYPNPYSNCDFTYDMIADYYYSKRFVYFNQIQNSNYFYSQSLCIQICLNEYIEQTCNCSIDKSSVGIKTNRTNILKRCRTSSKINCHDNSSIRDIFIEKCKEKCPLECNKIKYDSSIVNFNYKCFGFDAQDCKNDQDYVVLNFYFNSYKYIEYKEYPSITFFGLFSNLGGTASLFLGNYRFSYLFIY